MEDPANDTKMNSSAARKNYNLIIKMLWSYPQAKVTSSKDFLKDALKAHNNYRAKHGVKPLELCDDVIVMLH